MIPDRLNQPVRMARPLIAANMLAQSCTVLILTRVVGQDEDYSGVADIHPRFSGEPRKPPDRRNHMDTGYELIILQWPRGFIALADSDIAQYAAPLISVFLKCLSPRSF